MLPEASTSPVASLDPPSGNSQPFKDIFRYMRIAEILLRKYKIDLFASIYRYIVTDIIYSMIYCPTNDLT